MDSLRTVAETEECDFSKLSEKPRPLNMDRQRSFDERSLSELSIGFSPRLLTRTTDNGSRLALDHLDGAYSPGRRSGFNTPRSLFGYEPHPMVGEAWDALRRSLVYFRGKPVGTIAALDNSEEDLNYDQVCAYVDFVLFIYFLHVVVFERFVRFTYIRRFFSRFLVNSDNILYYF